MLWLLFSVVTTAVAQCPPSYESPPLILVSMDGFRANYLDRGLTPTLEGLAERGVIAPYMIPSYPSKTFPNHYTLVTGLYPESHGIIANSFYDPEFHARFEMGNEESMKERWWGGEPVWNTVQAQGKLSATFLWPGSDVPIGGSYPSYWTPYNYSIPYEDRVDQVLEWVSLPEEERPIFMSLYFDEPDHTAHDTGPDDPQVDMELAQMETILDRLVGGLVARGLLECVNLIVLADHGMASSVGIENYVIKLADYIPDVYDLAYVYTGAFARLDPKDDSEAGEAALMDPLTCVKDEMRVYLREDLPTRHHYSNNRRIDDIVLDVDAGYTVSVSYDYTSLGQHGYDNYFDDMDALFIASGPGFLEGVTLEPFHNIELYNLLCVLMGVMPSVNNGTEGALYHALRTPPTPPTLPQEDKPPTSQFPSGDLTPLFNISECEGDLTAPEDWLAELDLTGPLLADAEVINLPWGFPLSGNLPASLTLLHHRDHVTAYSESLKMPLWTSTTLNVPPFGTASPQPWCSDVRLLPDTAQSCPSYLPLQPFNVSMYPLFPPVFSYNASLPEVPYLTSNAVPVSQQLAERWDYLLGQMVPQWVDSLGPLNLILGPVFDNNADSFPDNFTSFSTPEVPSDMFAVITRCQQIQPTMRMCPHDELDSAAFIFPQTQFKSNCLDSERFANEFSAKVHDVEMATGLTFFPDLDFYDRTALVLRVHQHLWALN